MSRKRGFTMIEVILAIAVSTALFAAIVGATSASVFRNRYTDTVNDLNDYLKNVYARVINVQNIRTETNESSIYCTLSSMFKSDGSILANSPAVTNTGNDNYPGRTGCAIYGQLVTFGEKEGAGRTAEVRTYDIIGTVHDDDYDVNTDKFNTESGILTALQDVGINVVTVHRTSKTSSSCKLDIAGGREAHNLMWEGHTESIEVDTPLEAAFMVVRSPITGAVHTYVYTDGTINVQDFISTNAFSGACSDEALRNKYQPSVLINKAIKEGKFSSDKDLVICVASEDRRAYTSGRRAIRVLADGQNASAVQLADMDSTDEKEGNPCKH